VRDDEIVTRLHKIAHEDWNNSHPLDLSDEGLLTDLHERGKGDAKTSAADLLVLGQKFED
jgi:hypothetical protein